MKKTIVWIAMIVLISACACKVEAGWFGKKKETPKEITTSSASTDKTKAGAPEQKKQPEQKKEAEVKKIDKEQQKALDAKRAMVAEKRRRLNNTEWQVELRPLSGSSSPKDKKEADALLFKDNQVSIVGFEKKNFPPTNFTLSVQDDGIIVWETMQTSEKNGIAFWRGEMDGDMQRMQGILSYHLDEKTIRDYSFVSVSKGTIVPVATGN